MTRTTGTRPTAATRAAGALRNGFRERVITPPDADHDKARALWNGAIDKSAALTARADDGPVIDLSPMRRRAWARRFWEVLRPHSTGVYVKARHDPDNVFRLDQNIEPAPGRRPHARWAAMSAPQRPTTTGPPTAQPGRRRPRQGEPPPGSGQETPCLPTQR